MSNEDFNRGWNAALMEALRLLQIEPPSQAIQDIQNSEKPLTADREECLHCVVSRMITDRAVEDGEIDGEETVSCLIQVLTEVARAAEDPVEYGKDICTMILTEMPKAVKEELEERAGGSPPGPVRTRH